MVGERGDGGGLLELNEVPVGVELIGEHLREGCTHALTHLSMGHYGRDDVIRVELYPRMNECLALAGYVLRQSLGAIPRAKSYADHESAASQESCGDERPSSPLIHQPSPSQLRLLLGHRLCRSPYCRSRPWQQS